MFNKYDFSRWSDVKFGNICSNQEHSLLCPDCGYDCTHQGTVTVINRYSEDKNGAAITVADQSASVVPIDKDNIPGRRNCIVIDMSCEQGCKFSIIIIQNKGSTLMKYVGKENVDISKLKYHL